MTSSEARGKNRLQGETSPYLLQHAGNPVDWYPWGPEALERARREDRPILLSIGYAACHWCHVMERETFEDPAVAALMNAHFVCIKVDREERPDLDDVYMAATMRIAGSGGWPMTVFLTPAGEPFFAGTYFPPVDAHGRPSFTRLVTRLAEAWHEDRDAVALQARELTDELRAGARAQGESGIAAEMVTAAVEQLAVSYDARWGGFGRAPKFPAPAALALLARHHARHADARALEMLVGTLNGMKDGGLYDHLAGGFARYSTDERWHVPHFEKMLYDNAGLARSYLEGWQITRDPEYRRVATETLDYVMRELQLPSGGFASATDADSEGVEGKYFVWSYDELVELLGAADAERFAAYYDVTQHGNWEGSNVLRVQRPAAEVARRLDLSPEELRASLGRAREILLAARLRRVPPLTDDKVLVAWNALMIGALAGGTRVLGEPRWLAAAERALGFVRAGLVRPDGGLYRTARAGRAHLAAYLEDYAYLTDALVDVVEAGGSATWLDWAEELATRWVADFGDASGGAFFHTAHGHEQLIVRTREGHDSALPNPNAVAARALARLAVHLGRAELRERALSALRAYGQAIERAPRAFATALAVADFLLAGPTELVVVGEPEAPSTRALLRALGERYLPDRVVRLVDPRVEIRQTPLVAGKTTVRGASAVYVCRDYACQQPCTEVSEIDGALAAAAGAVARELSPGVIGGHATVAGTERVTLRHLTERAHGYTVLGRTGLSVARVGFGCYRVDDGAPEHRAALAAALTAGINLIDTSTNYTDGRSERLVGSVLRELVSAGTLAREEVVVVSKVGYAQGKNLAAARERKARGAPVPEMLELGADLWHCIHPEWIEQQLGASLDRLGLATLDVCLLHNPEYFFQAGEGGDVAARREIFYERLERAFVALEGEVRRGRIRAYGVSSNTLASTTDAPDHVSLPRVLAAAAAAGGDEHHLRVLQTPLNLIESRAAVAPLHDGKSLLELAREAGLAVLVNRPLNVILDDGLFRLVDPPAFEAPRPLDDARARVALLEDEFRRTLSPRVAVAPGSPPAHALFAWADRLAAVPERLVGLDQWRDLEARLVGPRIGRAVADLDRSLGGDREWGSWREAYLAAVADLVGALRAVAAERSRARLATLQRSAHGLLSDRPMVRAALRLTVAVPGVDVVLLGMRREPYVTDALAVLAAPRPAGAGAALAALAASPP